MPFNSVSDARSSIPALESLSDSQVSEFNRIFNSMIDSGTPEGEAIPIAISEVKKFSFYDDECQICESSYMDKADVSRDDNGNLEYRGEKFPGYGKPVRDSGKKQGKVLVRDGDRVSVVRFGDPSL